MTLDDNEPHPIWAWRGYAVGAYSRLEHTLCLLMQALLGTTGNKAAIVFFKITNTSARNNIIEALIKDKYGKNFNAFWNSYLKQIKEIDLKRNEIVHWASMNKFTGNEDIEISLVPPNFWSRSINSPEIKIQDLKEFIKKTLTFSDLCENFITFVCYQDFEIPPSSQLQSWLRIFHEPIIYPLPADHILFKKEKP